MVSLRERNVLVLCWLCMLVTDQTRSNVNAFVPSSLKTQKITQLDMGIGDFFSGLGKELDNMIDDAMDRKLGGGSTFYGERKSSFSETSKSYRSTSQTEAKKRDIARSSMIPDPLASFRGGNLSGEELRQLIFSKWGQRFPVLIKRRSDALGEQRLFLIIQWKRLGKNNLDLSEEEYIAESDAVAELVTEWGMANVVKNEISESTARPKTMTQQYPGLFIALDVDESIVATW
mmetsp:Transcript_40787/g.57343  ORF Transcript_40787/g.57343 Transcript_40787/m.57343 type:complete len:232 (-) Transcript_40787:150-845(-)|eukprot:CAMPEP_0202476124 /NCGR_PEP_ID=MMETSP1360-20130828/93258_1 /ASSEMBLY_ACC=CAM_ASM_000848 /TAXON_ID=515479 /ORGANISM="Licmophora paradoxa, Strain CCMP2313" /LENGTH=231 /DNA_ID=CAMNT_0049103317 /DNA_START=198 /DNA_END=893 /DNA_ORIENTATION=+